MPDADDAHPDDHRDDHDRGLRFDISRLMTRRRAITALGGAGFGAAFLAACATGSTPSAVDSSSSSGPPTTASSVPSSEASSSTTEAPAASAPVDGDECVAVIPEETAGPYPGDGSNGANVLAESGVVRSDITTSFGSSSTAVDGVPLDVVLTVRDAAACSPLAGAAVYVWHCDPMGRYSMYTRGVEDENFLRGVQETDANGQVRFTTVVPGCYPGRWPHVHFEVFESLAAATAGRNSIATSQLAFDEATSAAVYGDGRYAGSARNLSQLSLASDNVFGDDGGIHQLATTVGDVASGFTSALTVAV